MKYILKEMTEDEKPREKFKKYGINSLTDYELLALIIKSGLKDKSVLDLSIEIMNNVENVGFLNEITIEELISIKGIGEAKAMEILASIELGKRIVNKVSSKLVIKKAKDAYLYLKTEFSNLKQEYFICVYLDIKGKVISHRVISIGAINQTVIDFKDALKWGLKYSSSGIIFAHNHPSGDPQPSDNDMSATLKFKELCENVDIKFVDHIIIGKNCFYSFIRDEVIYE